MPNGRKNGMAKDVMGAKKAKREFAEYMRHEILEGYDQPFMGAVSALPRQDLAKMAESLVNLTAFLMRMRADSGEKHEPASDVDTAGRGQPKCA
jgi:hypothetical protein